MSNENKIDRLAVIANLIALQLTQDKDIGDSAWLLSRAGMVYSDIAQVLGISKDSVRAHVSAKRKQSEKAHEKRDRK